MHRHKKIYLSVDSLSSVTFFSLTENQINTHKRYFCQSLYYYQWHTFVKDFSPLHKFFYKIRGRTNKISVRRQKYSPPKKKTFKQKKMSNKVCPMGSWHFLPTVFFIDQKKTWKKKPFFFRFLGGIYDFSKMTKIYFFLFTK